MDHTARLVAVTIDCPEPTRLALFYRAFLGGQLRSDNPDFVVLVSDEHIRLDFQRVDNHQPPTWPDPSAPRRVHLDFRVDDLALAQQHLLQLGATLAPHQPGGHRFRILLDPAGHPFCIATPIAAASPNPEQL